MDEKSLKTSVGQRIVIVVVALLLLASTVMTYMFIVMSSSNSSANDEQIDALTAEFDTKQAEVNAAVSRLSEANFDNFKGYKSEVKAYNAASANTAGIETRDLKVGNGRTLKEKDYDYLAYYIGWCADGSVFDSSFDNFDEPTSLKAPISAAGGSLIEGWNQGVIGMKTGGVRQITIPGELAYADSREICGGYNTPLKFIILALEDAENYTKLSEELSQAYYQLYTALYGSAM